MKVRALFAQPRIFALAVIVGVALALPTLRNGLFLDDYEQRIGLLSHNHVNIFEFLHRGTPDTEQQVQQGVLPWWTYTHTKVVYFRPLAQWFTELDYRLWPNNFVLMHLQSVLWYGLAVLVASLAYQRLLPSRWGAGFAAALFAVDASHSAVAWLANRNVMPCLCAALLSLLCYSRRSWPWHFAGCALFAVSVAFGEAGLAIAGYYLAYEVALSEEPWRARLLRLLPYALVALAWLGWWKTHGFGVVGSGVYIDPLGTPSLFLRELVYRYPANLTAQWLLPPAEAFHVAGEGPLRPWFQLYALAMAAVLVWLLLPLLRRSRVARFFGLGMLIAVLPVCTSILMQRLLWFVGFGATGLLALFVDEYRALSLSQRRLRLSSAFAVTMMVLHLGISPLLFLTYSRFPDWFDQLMDSDRVHLPDQGPRARHLLAISTLDYIDDITFPMYKDEALSLGPAPTRSPPAITRIRALAEGLGEYWLLRPDSHTLIVSDPAGLKFSTMLRPAVYRLTPGEHIDLDDVGITVRSVSSTGAPTEIEYDFKDDALDHYEVIGWDQDHFAPATLPAVGQRVSVTTETACLWCRK